MIRQTFPNRPILRWALCVLALLGAVCAAVLLVRRVRAELRSDRAACAVCYSAVRTLAAADGRTERQWLDDLRAAGVSCLIVTDTERAEGSAAAEETGMCLASMGVTAQEGDAFLIPEIRADALVSDALVPDGAACLACTEDLARTGLLLPQGVDPDALPCPAVKTLWFFARYRQYSADDAPYSEPCNILFRAVTERGMRLLVLAPLEDENGVVTDPAVYAKLLSDLSARLAGRGITLGAEFSTLEAPAVNRLLLSGALLLLVCAAVVLLRQAFPVLPDWVFQALLPLGALCAVGLGLLRPTAAMTFGSFAAAVVGGCGAARRLYLLWLGKITADRRSFSVYVTTLSRLVLCGVLSGLYVGALLGCRTYMLGFTVFHGVKAAQALPLLIAAIALLQAVRADGGRIVPKGKRGLLGLIALAVLVLLGAAVLLLRSGDAGGLVSTVELRARNALERCLFVRPRSKEMLLAVPAAALFALSLRRRHPLFGIVFGVLAALETVSVINSFCHIVTPVHVTLIRTLLGAVIGFVIGAVLCALLDRLLPEKEH